MTKEEMLEQLKHDRDLCNFNPSTGESEPIDEDCRKSAKALDMAIKALEQQPCEDAISRQTAISHVDDVPYIKDHPNVGLLWKAWIESLPSAQPETCEGCKHSGKWEDEVENGYPSPCTRCKRRVGVHYER